MICTMRPDRVSREGGVASRTVSGGACSPLSTGLARAARAAVLAAGLAAGSVGCASPPAVTPLVRVARRALAQEARQVDAARQRDQQQVEQRRAALSRAFDADLEQRDDLSPAWVRDATDAYVSAREALLRHALTLEAVRHRRAENLDAAARAADRAIRLLEKQDRLLTDTLGVDGWGVMKTLLGEDR